MFFSCQVTRFRQRDLALTRPAAPLSKSRLQATDAISCRNGKSQTVRTWYFHLVIINLKFRRSFLGFKVLGMFWASRSVITRQYHLTGISHVYYKTRKLKPHQQIFNSKDLSLKVWFRGIYYLMGRKRTGVIWGPMKKLLSKIMVASCEARNIEY